MSTTFPKMTLDAVLKNFQPGLKPRDIQVAAIEKTIEGFNSGARYVVLEVPVGGGKSPIAMAFAKTMGRSYTLTLTEQLQMQYLRDFDESMGLRALKGRAKFTCHRAGEGFTCADGKQMYTGRDRCMPDKCPYAIAKNIALSADHTVANYHSFYFNLGLSAGRKPNKKGEYPDVPRDAWPQSGETVRELTILDEAHAAENFLMEQVGVTFNLAKLSAVIGSLEALPKENNADEVVTPPYLNYLRSELTPKLEKYLELADRRGILDAKTKDELNTALSKARGIIASLDEGDTWVAERDESDDRKGVRPDRFSLKPLQVQRYGAQLTGFSERLLLMSGTVLDAGQLVTNLGLNPMEGEAYSFDSPFPAENRPIYVGNLDMSYKARDESWPLMVSMVERILKSHPTQKGLLLCSSTKMLFHIIKELNAKNPALGRRILAATGEDRMKKYDEHRLGPGPTVLGASGFWEGADLKGKMSEFQVIPSLPRPMFKGQIKKRADLDMRWYKWLTYTKTLQGFGRSVRTETDQAATYVLDGDFRTELAKKNSLIPLWVRSSVTLVDG